MRNKTYADRQAALADAPERPHYLRMPAAHAFVIRDRRGRVLLRGRTADLSERGLFCLVDIDRGRRIKGNVLVEVSLPASATGIRRGPTRRARYAGRIVRRERLGQLTGLSIDLGEKLP